MNGCELMLGDWVMHNGVAKRVTCIWGNGRKVSVHTPSEEWGSIYADQVPAEEIEPIPLLEAIMKKNGFFYPPLGTWMKLDNPFATLYACLHTDGAWWLYTSGDCDKRDDFAQIRYIHELQHVLRLCGIEKEITL